MVDQKPNVVQLYATDSLLERNRFGRLIVLLLSIGATCAFPFLGKEFTSDIFNYGNIGIYIGLIVQLIILCTLILPRSILINEEYRGFVTVDHLRAFLGGGNEGVGSGDTRVYVLYGPGTHITYPWEGRSASGAVALEEASESFEVKIQTPKGVITAKGSIRLRPDIRYMVPFLSGVAAIPTEITDLLESFLVREIAGKQLQSTLKGLGRINLNINRKFGFGGAKDPNVSDFEKRFGVNVGDITIAELLPSVEVQKSMSGLTEAEVINQGTAILLGYESIEKARAANVSENAIDRARDRFLAASENVTMNVDANEYSLRLEGFEPELVQAIKELGPALAAFAGRRGSSGKRRRKRTGPANDNGKKGDS